MEPLVRMISSVLSDFSLRLTISSHVQKRRHQQDDEAGFVVHKHACASESRI